MNGHNKTLNSKEFIISDCFIACTRAVLSELLTTPVSSYSNKSSTFSPFSFSHTYSPVPIAEGTVIEREIIHGWSGSQCQQDNWIRCNPTTREWLWSSSWRIYWVENSTLPTTTATLSVLSALKQLLSLKTERTLKAQLKCPRKDLNMHKRLPASALLNKERTNSSRVPGNKAKPSHTRTCVILKWECLPPLIWTL